MRSWIGITSYKSTPPSSGSTSLCTRDDVTMVDNCKQCTTTSITHAMKNIQVNTFHGGLKAWMDICRHCVSQGSYLKYAFSIYKAKLWQSNRRIPLRSLRYIICIITCGFCSCNARLFNDDVTAIEVSYWRRRESPNYARLNRGKMEIHRTNTHCHLIYPFFIYLLESWYEQFPCCNIFVEKMIKYGWHVIFARCVMN